MGIYIWPKNRRLDIYGTEYHDGSGNDSLTVSNWSAYWPHERVSGK